MKFAILNVLATYNSDKDIYRGFQVGTQGYLLKDAKPNKLLTVMSCANRTQQYIPPGMGTKLVQRISNPKLSERELKVLCLMARGMSNLNITTVLSIGENIVKSHVNRILSKLRVNEPPAEKLR